MRYAANTLASGLDCASPEGIMDPASMSYPADQYSLGCILYYCLTGQYPFPGNNAVEKMMAHQAKEPMEIHELAPDVPDALVAVARWAAKLGPVGGQGLARALMTALMDWARSRRARATISERLSGGPGGWRAKKASSPATPPAS